MGLITRTIGTTDVTADDTLLDELMSLVRQHGTLYDWASEAPQPRALRGRAPVYVASLPLSGTAVVVRHAWHGGFFAPLTADRFRRPSRAPLEMQRSSMLRAAGIPTTEVLGFARYAAGFGLVRVDVVTRYVPDAADLGMVLAGLASGLDAEAAMSATLTLLTQLARTGVVHPDLNVKNVLLRPVGPATPVKTPSRCAFSESGASGRIEAVVPLEAMIIDVDVVKWSPGSPITPMLAMTANVTRLTRSLRKWRRHFNCDLADERIAAFAQAALASVR